MAYSYCRKPDDMSFRKIHIAASGIGKFEDFGAANQTIYYPDVGCVLEVKRKDGSTELFYDGPTVRVTYIAISADCFRMGSMPMERLWVRKADGTGIPYKVPAIPPDENNQITFRIPGGVSGMELYGDPYLEKIYTLVKK